MLDSPDSLQNICIDFVSENKNFVFTTVKNLNGDTLKYIFKGSSICMPVNVSELLFAALEENILTDQQLTIFDPSFTRLHHVYIRNASRLSTKGLSLLQFHKITELVVINLISATVNDLIECLGDWTLQNLQLLNVSHSTFRKSEENSVGTALSKMEKLKCLDVSFTKFDSQDLKIIASNLPSLQSINIAGTQVTDISALTKWSVSLTSLNLSNIKSYCGEILKNLAKFQNLQHLDVSDECYNRYFPSEGANNDVEFGDFIETLNGLPMLVSLDLSGMKSVDAKLLKRFLNNHKPMQFLGLMDNAVCQDDAFCRNSDPMFNPQLVVTGFATEAQILASLRRYIQRKIYFQKSFCYLQSIIRNVLDVRVDIIKLVIRGMKAYSDVLEIQMKATVYLYNLTKGSLISKIHPNWLRKIVNCTLVPMENFPNQLQIQKNALLVLYRDRILQDISFNRYHCVELVMNSLVTFDDSAMNHMSATICSTLVARLSTAETSNLGSRTDYMSRLLDMVKSKTKQKENDYTLKVTLSSILNLSDDSPRTCRVFLDLGGLDLFRDVLREFCGESSVEGLVLGVMNNIAEISYFRDCLMKDNFTSTLRTLLHDQHIEVSYFAAGIVANLASEREVFWSFWNQINWQEMVSELGSAVSSWDSPEKEIVVYRSFSPFYPLFRFFKAFQVQLWAAWAVHHVFSKNPKRYSKTLVDENGVEIIKDLLEHPDLHNSVATLCYEILQFVKEEYPNISIPNR